MMVQYGVVSETREMASQEGKKGRHRRSVESCSGPEEGWFLFYLTVSTVSPVSIILRLASRIINDHVVQDVVGLVLGQN